jgi:hypothetical protein
VSGGMEKSPWHTNQALPQGTILSDLSALSLYLVPQRLEETLFQKGDCVRSGSVECF